MLDVECEFVCRSCKLTNESLAWLNRGSTNITVQVLDDHRFIIRSKIKEFHTNKVDEAAYKAHRVLLLWLVSINVGSMEHFDFSRKELGIDDFKIKHHDTFGQALFKVKIELASPNSDRILDPGAAQRASLVFIALAQERDESILNEYVKGLYHYGAQLYGIDFWKEAFRLCLKTL